MKTMRKALAIVMAIAIIMSLGITAFAAAADTTPKITVKNPSTGVSIAGKNITVYKIFKLTYDGSSKYNYTPVDELADYTYTTPGDQGKTITSDKLVDYLYTVQSNSALLQHFANDIAGKAVSLGLPSKTQKVGAKSEQAVIDLSTADNLGLGYYLITVSPAPVGNNKPSAATPALSVSLDTTNYHPTVMIKSEAPHIDKDVKAPSDTGYKDVSTTAQIGETLNFKLTFNVPNVNGYEKYTFKINDTVSEGLNIDYKTFKITIGGNKVVLDKSNLSQTTGTDFKILLGQTDADSKTTTFTVVFGDGSNDFKTWMDGHNSADDDHSNDINVGDEIVLTYDAVLTDKALNHDAEKNSASLTYSTDPKVTDGGTPKETPHDDNFVYDFSLNINKYNGSEEVGEDGTPAVDAAKVPGAQFVLKDSTKTKYYKWTAPVAANPTEEIAAAPGKADFVKPDVEETYEDVADVFITGADGKLYYSKLSNGVLVADTSKAAAFKGLKAGTYYLEEVAAPDGFNKLSSDITIAIAENPNDGKSDVTEVTFTITDPTAKAAVEANKGTYTPQVVKKTITHTAGAVTNVQLEAAADIANKTGIELPSTGGIGTTIFYTVGGILMVTALALFITKKKMADN